MRLELGDEGFHAADAGNGVGAVIGGEDDGGGLFAADVGEGELFVVDVDELEVGGGGSLFEGDGLVVGGKRGCEETSGESQRSEECFHCLVVTCSNTMNESYE